MKIRGFIFNIRKKIILMWIYFFPNVKNNFTCVSHVELFLHNAKIISHETCMWNYFKRSGKITPHGKCMWNNFQKLMELFSKSVVELFCRGVIIRTLLFSPPNLFTQHFISHIFLQKQARGGKNR